VAKPVCRHPIQIRWRAAFFLARYRMQARRRWRVRVSGRLQAYRGGCGGRLRLGSATEGFRR
jgi:hypothetical protein